MWLFGIQIWAKIQIYTIIRNCTIGNTLTRMLNNHAACFGEPAIEAVIVRVMKSRKTLERSCCNWVVALLLSFQLKILKNRDLQTTFADYLAPGMGNNTPYVFSNFAGFTGAVILWVTSSFKLIETCQEHLSLLNLLEQIQWSLWVTGSAGVACS